MQTQPPSRSYYNHYSHILIEPHQIVGFSIEQKLRKMILKKRNLMKGQEVCYASLHSESASALGLLRVWSLWGNQEMARCQEMSTLPAGYTYPTAQSVISEQQWVTGFFCVCELL